MVAGGGLAGVAAAIALCDSGARVTLAEARPRLGGATCSFTRGGLTVDNGQHIFLRCCTAYRGLLDRLGVTAKTALQERFDVRVLTPSGAARLRRRGLPAPLHLAATLATYPLLSRAERAGAVRAALAFRRLNPADPATDRQRLGDWLAAHGQGPRARRALWDLFVVSSLNIAGDDASLALAAMVIKTALLGDPGAADIGVPLVPLGELHGQAADTLLRRLGATVLTGAKVTAVSPARRPGRGRTRASSGFTVRLGGAVARTQVQKARRSRASTIWTAPGGRLPGGRPSGDSPAVGASRDGAQSAGGAGASPTHRLGRHRRDRIGRTAAGRRRTDGPGSDGASDATAHGSDRRFLAPTASCSRSRRRRPRACFPHRRPARRVPPEIRRPGAASVSRRSSTCTWSTTGPSPACGSPPPSTRRSSGSSTGPRSPAASRASTSPLSLSAADEYAGQRTQRLRATFLPALEQLLPAARAAERHRLLRHPGAAGHVPPGPGYCGAPARSGHPAGWARAGRRVDRYRMAGHDGGSRAERT